MVTTLCKRSIRTLPRCKQVHITVVSFFLVSSSHPTSPIFKTRERIRNQGVKTKRNRWEEIAVRNMSLTTPAPRSIKSTYMSTSVARRAIIRRPKCHQIFIDHKSQAKIRRFLRTPSHRSISTSPGPESPHFHRTLWAWTKTQSKR